MTLRALLTSILVGAMAASPLFAAGKKKKKDPGYQGPAATVLCYHIVESPNEQKMYVSRETFRQQMDYLTMTGYTVIPLRHLYEFVTGKRESIPKNAVVITIDDGWRSTYTEVFPELKKRKFPFTVFVYPKIIGMTALALSWKQVQEMAEAGVDIQSHTLSHAYLTQRRHGSLDDEEYAAWLRRELAESKTILEKKTGKKVQFLAYPYGDYDARVAGALAGSGYAAGLTCDYGRVVRGSDPFRMKRVIIDRRMDFATFRHYLGARRMELAEISPPPGEAVEPEQPLVISAKIRGHESIDPASVGIALLGSGKTIPFSYDARDGSISIVVRDAVEILDRKPHRAIVWATEAKSGRRLEASWTFRIPEPAIPEESRDIAGGGGRPAASVRIGAESRSLP